MNPITNYPSQQPGFCVEFSLSNPRFFRETGLKLLVISRSAVNGVTRLCRGHEANGEIAKNPILAISN
jgi:hypothetical protein